jgi:nucleoside-diphosphate-sugar epimerase
VRILTGCDFAQLILLIGLPLQGMVLFVRINWASFPSIHGAVNVVSPHPVTQAEFAQTLARHLHRPARGSLFRLGFFALRLESWQMRFFWIVPMSFQKN